MTENEYHNTKEFCPIPWTSFFIWPDGRVESCCQSKNELGNLNDSKINQILVGKKNVLIKNEMLLGTQVAGCQACYPHDQTIKSEDFNYKRTMRYDFLELLENYDKTLYSDTNAFEYRYADLRFRTTCNYACVYCTPYYSSLWSEELKEPFGLDKSKVEELVNFYLENISTLKSLYMAGGEPLLIKENLIILEALAKENLDCNISINTNLSQIENNKIFDALLKFNNCHWIVSVDDIEERYNYIRYPGNWELFFKNLLTLREKVGTHKISFSMVYSALNAQTIFEAIDYLVAEGFQKSSFDIYYVNNGRAEGISDRALALDPRNLSQNYINNTIELIKKNLFTEEQIKIDKSKERFNNQCNAIISFLNNKSSFTNTLTTWHSDPMNQQYKNILLKELEILDKRRCLNSQSIFPNIYQSFKY